MLKRSLKLQIYSFIAALLTIMLLLLNTYPLFSSRQSVFEEKRRSLSSQCTIIAASLASLDKLSENGAAEVMRLLDISGLDRTVIVNSDGSVMYDSAADNADLSALSDLQTAIGGKTVFHSVFADSAFTTSYSMPVVSQGQTLGAVYVFERDFERAGLILSVQKQIRNISIIISVSALLIAVLFSRTLIERIRELVRSMRIVASGNYAHRLSTRGKDEITELGNEFNLLTERLDTNEKQRRRFVSDASHELKTPLASIRLLADSIVQSRSMDDETMRDFVTDIGHEAERLQRTTEKLLDLSRLDDGVQIVPEPVDVKQAAQDAIALVRPLAEEKELSVHSELEDGCVIMATTEDMFHIIFNLVENAVKYNVPHGSVNVILRASEENITLTVEDTGIGIPENERLNIFGRFYRVDKARSRASGGSGLGLSIVHDAVIAHGGTIAVGQNKPQGSKFIVTFPRPSAEETGI